MWRQRSPMIVRVERELDPKPLSWWKGIAFVIIFLAAYFAVNILLNTFDAASKGAQWTILGLLGVVAFATLLRYAAKSADMSVGEYLCHGLFRSGSRGWD
ncbi:MAG: hypothetical protein AAB402_04760 [Patescibacteria group bacterium]